MTINLPFPVHGTIYDTDGSTPVGSGVMVYMRNERTNERINTTTNANGEYVLDGGNFPNGYENGDNFTVFVIYTNLEGSGTVSVASATHSLDITLSTVATADTINYCTVQQVWDMLDGISASDLSAENVIDFIQRAEAEIDSRTGRKFTTQTATNEEYNLSNENYWISSEGRSGLTPTLRTDRWNYYPADRIQLKNRPVISITSLQTNSGGEANADSWTTRTEQTGSGGDYILTDPSAGEVTFVNNYPQLGFRRVRVTYTYGFSSVPKEVERLTVLLAVKDVVIRKSDRSNFDSIDDIRLPEISIRKGSNFTTFMNSMDKEIDRLWEVVGKMRPQAV